LDADLTRNTFLNISFGNFIFVMFVSYSVPLCVIFVDIGIGFLIKGLISYFLLYIFMINIIIWGGMEEEIERDEEGLMGMDETSGECEG
jgi:hypothetical protein